MTARFGLAAWRAALRAARPEPPQPVAGSLDVLAAAGWRHRVRPCEIAAPAAGWIAWCARVERDELLGDKPVDVPPTKPVHVAFGKTAADALAALADQVAP